MVPDSPSPAAPPAAAGPLAAFLAGVELGASRTHGALTLWPLVRRGAAPGARSAGAAEPPPHVLLAQALEDGSARVDEVSDAGAVPFVRVTNDGRLPLLVLFGEEMLGAKQNRVANASFLVPADASLVIDVSCVEYGRWERPSAGAERRFRAAGRVVSHALRRKMAARVAAARARGARFAADQLEVWDEVEARLARSGATSPTRAYAAYVEHRASQIAGVVEAFVADAGAGQGAGGRVEGPEAAGEGAAQVGFVAAMGGEIAGMEVLGRAETFARIFPALLRSYAIDAVEADETPLGTPDDAACVAFLDALVHAPASTGASLGHGRDHRLQGDRLSGCALTWRGVVHAVAWPVGAEIEG
jgi:ARG and Rhodanese-Phosphatase-superfamily-associated Protein domain